MSWVDDFAARHGLDAAAADELRREVATPLSGAFGSLGALADPGEPDRGPLELQSLLGRGALGEVYRARDPRLDRTIAVKVLRADRRSDPHAVARFQREAQVQAALQHPGIPPVYDIGVLDDGRPYVAVLEIVGETLRELALDHHSGRRPRSLRRRVALVQRLAEAAGYAHRQGVVHRDIKPSNAMVSARGTVYLVDWGLAASIDAASAERVGTPEWMAPEVVDGVPCSPPSDVWALGRVLHSLVEAHALSRPSPVSPDLPDGLAELLAHALDDDPARRPADASVLADALNDWLDGARRLERARALVSESAVLQAEAEGARAEALTLRASAAANLEGVQPHDPIGLKRAGWEHQDAAARADQRSEALLELRLSRLEEALSLAPDLPEALQPLADSHRAASEASLRSGEPVRAQAHLERVRRYDRGPHAAWLRGLGRLTLVTSPPGATVTLCTYTERDRQLVPEPLRELGTTPLEVDLPHGAYLLLLECSGRSPVRYPIRIDRLEHWTGGRDGEPYEVYLPAEGELGPDEVYIPGGPFVSGADSAGFQSMPLTRSFEPGFAMQRHPVTHGEYLRFLDALVADNEPDLADRWAPRERGMAGSHYGRRADGGYALIPDSDGDLWREDWPVFFVNAPCAEAYAQWLSTRTGRAWTLPGELQHEKAARGADGRVYPWGDHFDPTFACLRESHPGRPLPASIHDFPVDRSVYGVRGLAGNVRAWCREPYAPPGGEPVPSQRVLRGGCFFFPSRGAHGAARMGLDAHRAGDTVGIRLVRGVLG